MKTATPITRVLLELNQLDIGKSSMFCSDKKFLAPQASTTSTTTTKWVGIETTALPVVTNLGPAGICVVLTDSSIGSEQKRCEHRGVG